VIFLTLATPREPVFVGLIMSGRCAEQDPPALLVVAAVQPKNSQTVAPDGIAAVAVVQVIDGALPAVVTKLQPLSVAPPRLAFSWTSPEVRLLNIQVDADGDDWLVSLLLEVGYVMMIFPPLGIVVSGVKTIVCIAVIGVVSTLVLFCVFAVEVVNETVSLSAEVVATVKVSE